MKALWLAALVGSTLLGACGGGSSITANCQEACKVEEGNPCTSRLGECQEKCKTLASQAEQSGFQKVDCGKCIAGQFKYSISPKNECWGVLAPTGIDIPACAKACIEPDAGVR